MGKQSHSVVDMVVLGILQRKAMNAYHLTQFVEERGVARLVQLSTPAVYKSCKRLYEKGFLSGKTVRETEAPEKMVYKVTRSGREQFRTLMSHFATKIKPFYFDFNSVVYSLEQLDYKEGLKLIEVYTLEIKSIQSWLIEHAKEEKPDFASRMIVKQYLMVIEVLVKWVVQLRKEFRKERS